jgi:biotin carboxylase
MKKKLAILGASYLQKPLVEKAIEMGIETHAFAWKEGCVVNEFADFYYPISIIDKEEILKFCSEIEIDGITSIASDIAMPTVNYIAEKLNLVGNSIDATEISTDKFKMRHALQKAGINCPQFKMYKKPVIREEETYRFPVIAKPVDRSGSRGVTKVLASEYLNAAIDKAISHSFKGACIVEEFLDGEEYSVEGLSYRGEHKILAITEKVTTGAPYFVEIQHHQPARISIQDQKKIIQNVEKALNALSIEYGASHAEIFLNEGGNVHIGEVSGRMGGDFIGSDMVRSSTGFDYVKAVIEIALGSFTTEFPDTLKQHYSGVYYLTPRPGKIVNVIDRSNDYAFVTKAVQLLEVGDEIDERMDSSSKRAGVVVYESKEGFIDLDPEEVLEFKTTGVPV